MNNDKEIEIILKKHLNSKVFEWHKKYKDNSKNSDWIKYICSVLTSEYQYEIDAVYLYP